MMDDNDALHAARALLGGKPLNIKPEALLSRLQADPRYSGNKLDEARRLFAATIIGNATDEFVKAKTSTSRKAAAVRLARAVRPILSDRKRGWLRFLLELGKNKGSSGFKLTFNRRAHSKTSQSKRDFENNTRFRRSIKNSVVAGSILNRIEISAKNGRILGVGDAISEAINCCEIKTDEEAARAAWQEFCRDCAALTQEPGSYVLRIYDGRIAKYKGCRVAIPDAGAGSRRLPPSKGGRPKKTS